VLNIAGCGRYRGAAVISTKAAYRAGAGLVSLASTEEVLRPVSAAVPEAVLQKQSSDNDGYMTGADLYNTEKIMRKADSVLVGCGLGDTPHAKKITEYVIFNAKCPVIVDADGINSICGNIHVLKENDCPKAVTPHPGEFSRMTNIPVNEINRDRIGMTKEFAREYNCVTVLKGAYTVIADPRGRCRVNASGNPALAVAGAGDALAGIIAAFLAAGTDVFEGACAAVYLHGLAADYAAGSMSYAGILPSDIVDLLPRIRKRAVK